MKIKITYILIFLNILLTSISGQNLDEIPIPDHFRDIIFGDTIDEVKNKLKVDSYFSYRGDPDVSMKLRPDRSIIDTTGSGLIKRAFFLFTDNLLYQITIKLNQELIDFYTVQIDLTGKYGSPVSLDPSGMIWENGKYRISLEYPLTVKYTDLIVFNGLLEENEKKKSNEEILREEFLKSF